MSGPAKNPISSSRVEGNALLVSAAGEIDLNTSPALRTALFDLLGKNKQPRLILNLGGVPYMDSSGIAVLVETLQRLRKSGGKLYLTAIQPRVRSVLEIARLDAIFILAKDDAEALAK